eukprot:m51a1_g6823 putative myosin-IC (1126) ;mRNA; f:16060-20597
MAVNKVGVDDMVMLSKLSNDTIVENLKKRYGSEAIYTYIGHVLVSLNPYKMIKALYSDRTLKDYRGKYPYELPPHVFALADDMYRHMLSECANHCVIISGESGAGKTEASKMIMHYIAVVSGHNEDVARVKDIILESNPLLEAFGNAKTVRNNNSSRFGKYMEIQFNRGGDPMGGRVTNYLLEKSRIVYQAPGERNFHSFYVLLAGADSGMRNTLRLRGPEEYHYTNQGDSVHVDGVDDANNFQEVVHAMDVIGITKQEQMSIWQMVAAILWLGNITFTANAKDEAQIADRAVLETFAHLLGVDARTAGEVLTHRTISTGTAGRSARVSTYSSPLDVPNAEYARDAMAKALYSRLFDWIVARVNHALGWHQTDKGFVVLSILDIYGFEIFGKNTFEQLCINYVNEKLQQIFIELTLKSEQEEYKAEGIPWEDVEYFNNKVCCDLIENNQRPAGLLRILDDVCTMPKGTDEKFLQQSMETYATHEHFIGYPQLSQFIIKHYAGDVTYCIDGFCDKNRDTLFYDHMDLCCASSNPIVADLFPEARASDRDKKRPSTAGFKIKNSIADLVAELNKCKMHYIRCVKPNDSKSPMTFDNALVLHQVKYLGLLENTRIRRAGFAFRDTFDKFFYRFRVCCKETFPNWSGDAVTGSEFIVKSVLTGADEKTPFARGHTKIFVRKPETLFALEELRERRLQTYAYRLQRYFLLSSMQSYYDGLKKDVNDRFVGKKERRRASIEVTFRGDYANYRDNMPLKAVVSSSDKFLFAHAASDYDKSLKMKRVVAIITDKALYLVSIEKNTDKAQKKAKPFVYALKRRIELGSITGIAVSPLKDNFVALRCAPPGPDALVAMRRKTEFISVLMRYGNNPSVSVEPAIRVSLAPKKSVEIKFDKNPAGRDGILKSKKVIVEEGLPSSSQPTIHAVVAPSKPYQRVVRRDYELVADAFDGGSAPSHMSSRPAPPARSGPAPAAGAPRPAPPRAAHPPASTSTSAAPLWDNDAGSGPAAHAGHPSGAGRALPSPRSPTGGAGGPTSPRTLPHPAPGGRGAPGAVGRAVPAAPGRGAPASRALPRPAKQHAKAMYDFEATRADELSLREGDEVTINTRKGEWYEGECGGRRGLFPVSYVEILS